MARAGSARYTMWRDDAADPPLLLCEVGATRLTYLARAADDPHRRTPTRRNRVRAVAPE